MKTVHRELQVVLVNTTGDEYCQKEQVDFLQTALNNGWQLSQTNLVGSVIIHILERKKEGGDENGQ